MNGISKIAITILFLISTISDICLAAGKDNYVVLDTRDFLEACGLRDKGFGHKAILTKEYANSSDGQDLIMRFVDCQTAYLNGRPSDAPGKPEEIIEALRRHSVGHSLYGGVKFLDGDRYVAVTKSAYANDYNDPKGGWGCIDYDGNVKIPLKYHPIIDGNTDLNAIVIDFMNTHTDERYPFFCITNTYGKIALFDKDLRQITEYKFVEWSNIAPYWSGSAIGEKDTHIDIRTMQVVSGPHSKDPDWR